MNPKQKQPEKRRGKTSSHPSRHSGPSGAKSRLRTMKALFLFFVRGIGVLATLLLIFWLSDREVVRSDSIPQQIPSQQITSRAATSAGSAFQPEAANFSDNVYADLNAERQLPFNEHELTLTEWVRRVDYALAQTSISLGMGEEELELMGFEKRVSEGSAYTFQRLSLLLPGESGHFIEALERNLKAFAPGSQVFQVLSGQWQIRIADVPTHEIRLEHKGTPKAFEEYEEGDDTPSTVLASPDELMGTLPRNSQGRLAIVIDDLGARLDSMRTIVALDYPVSVAIWPYGAKARESAELAHIHNLTILVHMPMEPVRYPDIKPGPNALYRDMDTIKVHELLKKNIAKVPHASGINNHMGSRFTQWQQGVDEVAKVAAEHSFFVLDSVTHPRSGLFAAASRLNTPAYKRHVFLDNEGRVSYVLKQLELAERVALHQGEAVAIGHPLPATLKALKLWESRRNPQVELVLLPKLTPRK